MLKYLKFVVHDGAKEREQRRHDLHRALRRTSLVHAAIVGLIAGFLAVAFQVCVRGAESFSDAIAKTAQVQGPFGAAALILFCIVIGSAAAGLIGRLAPDAGGSGIPHIKAALLHLRIIHPIRLILAKFAGGLAALAIGMSLGREGPTVQMGASVGKLVGDVLRAPRRGRNALLAAGAGAGLAAAFNAPLAGFLFVMEELKREMSALTYGAALIASVCAVAVTRFLIGEHPSFSLANPGGAPLSILPLAAMLGIVAGVAGIAFNKALIGALEFRRIFKVPRWVYGGLAGLASAILLLHLPEVTGGGHALAERLLSAASGFKPSVGMIILLFAGKLLFTAASYGTGLPGGIFAPILVMGSLVGYGFGYVATSVSPGIPFSPPGFATLGMAAMLAGSVRAPLTGVVLIVEMTGEYSLLYSLLVSAFAASLIADALRDEPIYEALMERDLRLSGAEVHPDEEPFLLEILVEPHSTMDGRRVRYLGLPTGSILVTLERGSRHIVPGGATMLSAGDMISVMVEGDKPEISQTIHEMAKAPR